MFDDDDSDSEGEVEIRIAPRDADLEAGGITDEDFTRALESAIDDWERDDAADDQVPLEDRLLQIRGKSFRLGDLADIDVSVQGDIPEFEEDGE
jgi:hypothetical protein